MATTFTKIASVSVGSGGAATIDFTSIPSTYTDLVIKYSLRCNGTNGAGAFYFNSDTTNTNYASRRLGTDGSSAFSNNYAAPYGAYADKSTYTASTFANGEIYIPNYRSSNNKSFSVDDVVENNATTADLFLTAGIWNNTAAITAVRIAGVVDSFVQYSTAMLYGIKNS
jgi:hypothetical protein